MRSGWLMLARHQPTCVTRPNPAQCKRHGYITIFDLRMEFLVRYFARTLSLKPFVSILCLIGGFAGSNVSGATSATYPVGAEPKAVAVADFNSDGKKDLTSVNRIGHTVSVLLGDGAGNFGAATNFSTGDTFSEPFGLAVGDFNNDGKTDVVVSKPNVHLVSLLLGDGSGGLGAPVDFSVGENPATFGVGDFNGDD